MRETKRPSGKLPVSPRMILAGGKLKNKNPKVLPAKTTVKKAAPKISRSR